MPIISTYSQKRKTEYFLKKIPVTAKILEIGPGSGWVKDYFTKNDYTDYLGIDIFQPADIVGDIRNWNKLGLNKESFDVIIAFEVIEHVDCLKECHELLVPGGRLMLTSPLPHMDPLMKALELVGLNQKRTSPHNNLIYFKDIEIFAHKEIIIAGFMSQWGILTK